jgi:ATP-dependent DNA helicase RecQ
MGGGACIGAITEQGESVRLVPFDADPHDGANLEYDIGSIWEISSEAATSLIPPHNENIIVVEKEYLFSVRELVSAIELLMPSSRGGPNTLYEGLLQNTGRGSLFITERSGIPPYSTTFWRPDQALTRDTEGRRVRYRYPAENGECTLTFVGFQEPLETIPAGTLLRVSLAHWWRPENTPDVELRCYAQLSGWFLEEVKQEKLECPVEVESSSAQMLLRTPLEILQNVFGHVQFRPLQAGIIDHILERHDLLIVLPTGGGKSLCYQVPALIFDGVTVVVSPLISLMRDQVMQLQQRNVSAVFLNSTLGHPEYLATMQRVKRGNVKLLYMAPETLMRPEILLMLDESNMSCLAIDEAHCISEWGYDFRPEYRELVSVRKRFPQAICLTLTATATPRVRVDIG